jgi:hypothetical protein
MRHLHLRLRRHGSYVNGKGVALIEALIALAIMAFGMLAVAGMQATLRQNGDLARQRAEAVRIAQTTLEQWRSFGVLVPVVGLNNNHAYSTLQSVASTPVANNGTNNTAYSVELTVPQGAGLPGLDTAQQLALKTLVVDVGWLDRSGDPQSVRLSSTIHGVAPELAATLSVPPNGGPTSSGGHRRADIPWDAVRLDRFTSGFKPPQAATGNVVWVFNNLTGLIKVCSLVIVADGVVQTNISCANFVRAQLLRGSVNFATDANSQATAAQAKTPTGTPFPVFVRVKRTAPGAPLLVDETNGCFVDTPKPDTPHSVRYFCAVPVDNAAAPADTKWSGTAYVAGVALPAPPTVGAFSSCRYTSSKTYVPPQTMPNVQHPQQYLDVDGPLSGQNFLIVRVVANNASDCPQGLPLPAGSTTAPQPQSP